MVVIDEAHTLLKKEASQISKRLGPIRTKRRIILSGTPFVNNLSGEFRFTNYVVNPGFSSPLVGLLQSTTSWRTGFVPESLEHHLSLNVNTSSQSLPVLLPILVFKRLLFKCKDRSSFSPKSHRSCNAVISRF
jgi:hypothetical protein